MKEMLTVFKGLRNDVHIDRVVNDVVKNHGYWADAWMESYLWKKTPYRDGARGQALRIVKENGSYIHLKRIQTYIAAQRPGCISARDAGFDTVLALLAWKDCSHMLDSEVGELKIIAEFGNLAAKMLLPASIVHSTYREIHEQLKPLG